MLGRETAGPAEGLELQDGGFEIPHHHNLENSGKFNSAKLHRGLIISLISFEHDFQEIPSQ